MSLLDYLAGLRQVLFVGELGGVKQHRVPAGGDAVVNHLAVGAVVQMERGRHRRAARHFGEHHLEELGAHHLDGLYRHLNDDGRFRLGRRGQHCVHRYPVDNVERAYAIPLVEGVAQNLLHGNHRH